MRRTLADRIRDEAYRTFVVSNWLPSFMTKTKRRLREIRGELYDLADGVDMALDPGADEENRNEKPCQVCSGTGVIDVPKARLAGQEDWESPKQPCPVCTRALQETHDDD